MNNRLNSEIISMTVKEFTDIKLDKKIKLEESFQRGTDQVSSWNDDNKKDYIHSTLVGTATNPIHVVDIKKALQYNEGADPESYEIFKKYEIITNKEFENLISINNVLILDQLNFDNWTSIINSSTYVITPECGCTHIASLCETKLCVIYDLSLIHI